MPLHLIDVDKRQNPADRFRYAPSLNVTIGLSKKNTGLTSHEGYFLQRSEWKRITYIKGLLIYGYL